MTTKTFIFMNIAYLNGNFDGKLAKNLAAGSVGRRGDLRSGHIRIPLHIFLRKLFESHMITERRWSWGKTKSDPKGRRAVQV